MTEPTPQTETASYSLRRREFLEAIFLNASAFRGMGLVAKGKIAEHFVDQSSALWTWQKLPEGRLLQLYEIDLNSGHPAVAKVAVPEGGIGIQSISALCFPTKATPLAVDLSISRGIESPTLLAMQFVHSMPAEWSQDNPLHRFLFPYGEIVVRAQTRGRERDQSLTVAGAIVGRRLGDV